MSPQQDEVLRVADKETVKQWFKEALKEWLDEKILTFGRWSLMTLAAGGLAALVYFILWTHGWRHS